MPLTSVPQNQRRTRFPHQHRRRDSSLKRVQNITETRPIPAPPPTGPTTSTAKTADADQLANSSSDDDADAEAEGLAAAERKARSAATLPQLLHRFRHTCSILAIVSANSLIYAATQQGEILVYALDTFERVALIEGHQGSVLGLCLSHDKRLLFSSAADRIVNVWNARTFRHISSIYSSYDLGDIFCVSYSSRSQTVYLGAQNTSIQWCDLKTYDSNPPPDLYSHPSLREDRFFDSSGPGGVRTAKPRHVVERRLSTPSARSGRYLEIDNDHIHQFAHYGFVYCMLLTSSARIGCSTAVVPADSEILISGGGDGAIKLWSLDPADGGRIHEVGELCDDRSEGDSILTIVLDGTFLYAGRVEGEINVWDLETRQFVRMLKSHDADVMTLSIGQDLVFSADVDGMVMKFDQRHELVNAWKAHSGRVLASFVTRHGHSVLYVTGGNDDTIAVWDISGCQEGAGHVTRSSHEQLFESLRQFISYRTVSADPIYKSDCRRGASYLRAVLKKFGATTELMKTEDGHNPIVFARFKGNPSTSAKRKKILFYGHYDVIRAENRRGKWITDPFTMEGIDGFLYGRGISDNKGPIMAAIYAVADLVEKQELDSDIVFLIEGEEECGSRGFRRAIRAYKDLIGPIDWILLANSYWLDDEVPCLTYGLRGVVNASIEVRSDEPDLHSGVDGSRLLDEALKDLVMLLARLSGPAGHVEIPHFYDDILPVTDDQHRLYREISASLLARNPDIGTPESLIASLMKRWGDASLTIHNFRTSGPSNTTVIPHVAQAAISLRLVPNQEVDDVVESLTSFLHSEFTKLGSSNTLTVTINQTAMPWLGDYNNQIFKTLERAVIEAWRPKGHRASVSATSTPRILQSPRRASTTAAPASSPSPAGPATPTTQPPIPPLATSSTLATRASPTTPPKQIQRHIETEIDADTPDTNQALRSPIKPHLISNSAATSPTSPLTSKAPAHHQSPSIASVTETATATTEDTAHAQSDSQFQSPPHDTRETQEPTHVKEGFKPLYIREGGSIPAVRFLEKEFGAPAAHLPCGMASDNAHLDNERFRVLNLWKAVEIFRRVFVELPGK